MHSCHEIILTLPLKEREVELSLSPKKNEWVKKVGKEGSLRMDGWTAEVEEGKMTNHKKHNNITHTKRWEEERRGKSGKALHIVQGITTPILQQNQACLKSSSWWVL